MISFSSSITEVELAVCNLVRLICFSADVALVYIGYRRERIFAFQLWNLFYTESVLVIVSFFFVAKSQRMYVYEEGGGGELSSLFYVGVLSCLSALLGFILCSSCVWHL